MNSKHRRLQCGVSSTLDSSRWIRLSKGLDDFRYGPPGRRAGRIIPASPAIIHERYSGSTSTATESELSLKSAATIPLGDFVSTFTLAPSKLTLIAATDHSTEKSQGPKKVEARTKQKKHIKTIEQKLKENPLILFPYLESDIPHEVFEKLMNILGPTEGVAELSSRESPSSAQSVIDLKTEDKLKVVQSRKMFSRKSVSAKPKNIDDPAGSSIFCGARVEGKETPSVLGAEEAAKQVVKSEKSLRFFTDDVPSLAKTGFDDKGFESAASLVRPPRRPALDPYRAFLKRANYTTETEKMKRKTRKADQKPPEEAVTNVRQVAEDFCNWMQTIGGEDAKFSMDVDKVLTLFAMNAELESLQTTSQVLDEFPLTSEEIEAAKARKASKSLTKLTTPSDAIKLKQPLAEEDKFKRLRYGAWYLDISQWKKLKPGQLLEDPEEVVARQKHEASKSSDDLDTQLRGLHTYKELMMYITRNNLKVPNFLKFVQPPTTTTTSEST